MLDTHSSMIARQELGKKNEAEIGGCINVALEE